MSPALLTIFEIPVGDNQPVITFDVIGEVGLSVNVLPVWDTVNVETSTRSPCCSSFAATGMGRPYSSSSVGR